MTMLNPYNSYSYGSEKESSFKISTNKLEFMNQNSTEQRSEAKYNHSEGDETQFSVTECYRNTKEDRIGKWLNPGMTRLNTDPYVRKYHTFMDKSLPKQLKELFTPLKCYLCNCVMSSTAPAKRHYEGKKHVNNVKKWFTSHPEYCDINTVNNIVNAPRFVDPNKFYCRLCDVILTSELQALSHYEGKKHHFTFKCRKLQDASFDDRVGKFEQLSLLKDSDLHSDEARHLFSKDESKEMNPDQKYFCQICQVCCYSEISLKEHLAGSKHKKKLKIQNYLEPFLVKNNNILQEVIESEKKFPSGNDLSVFRTPSGKYYCRSCNITVNSLAQFHQHFESKKHKMRSIQSSAKRK